MPLLNPIRKCAVLAALAAAASACGSLRSPATPPLQHDHPVENPPKLQGYAALNLWAPVADGSVLAEGVAESSSGSHRAVGTGALAEFRSELVFAAVETSFVGLPSQLDLDVAGDDDHQRTEYRHSEILVGADLLGASAGGVEEAPGSFEGVGDGKPLPPAPALRFGPFLGGRFSRFVVREEPLGDGHGETWSDLIAGARAEARLASGVLLRLKGDTLVFGRSDEAWRASAAVVVGHEQVRFAFGWEALSVDFEGDTGLERVVYSVLTHGPFVAVEFWF